MYTSEVNLMYTLIPCVVLLVGPTKRCTIRERHITKAEIFTHLIH